jgi:peptidyl-tRNA hydrolase, PTH2 family
VKQVIVLRRDLNMRLGKAVAQGAHASMMWLLGDADALGVANDLAAWARTGMTKICVRADSEMQLLELHKKAVELGLRSYYVVDAGRTEFHGEPTFTALAVGPGPEELVDQVTGGLKLL